MLHSIKVKSIDEKWCHSLPTGSYEAIKMAHSSATCREELQMYGKETNE